LGLVHLFDPHTVEYVGYLVSISAILLALLLMLLVLLCSIYFQLVAENF